ncbi:MAG TPA: BPSS1780 family membrane protein [Rubrivivax sp.]
MKTVAPAQGVHWLREAFRLFARAPLGFSLMFVAFLVTAVFSSAIPVVGPLLMLAALPLLSLGFMIASESALAAGPVHPGQFLAPLRGDKVRRRSLLILCAAYGITSLAVLLLSDWVDGGAFERLQRLMAESGKSAEIDALIAEPSFTWGLFIRFGLAALLAVPFWHAPALVHWGAQGPAQALFSSALAVWRSKGAFLVYSLAWLAIILLFGVVAALLFRLFGAGQMAGLVALPAGLIFSTVFYVSLLFTFRDSFDANEPVATAP